MKIYFNHAAHVALWDWLSKNPSENKENWPGWEQNGGPYREEVNLCFACPAATCIAQFINTKCPIMNITREEVCPLDWGVLACAVQNSPYLKWSAETNLFMRSIYARQIRDLPVRWHSVEIEV